MSRKCPVAEITARVEFTKVEPRGRIYFTLISGECRQPFSISRAMALLAIDDVSPLLFDEPARDNVQPIRKRAAPPRH